MTPKMIKLMERAEKTNRERDKLDGGIQRLPLVMQVSTACQAIATGCNTEEWNCVAEGLEMLFYIETAMRKEAYGE